MRTKLARFLDVLLIWTQFIFLLFFVLLAVLAAHGGHVREDELPKGFAPAAIFVWTFTLVGWGAAVLILSRRLNRRLGFSSGGIFLTLCLVALPVYGYLYYRRNLRELLFGETAEAPGRKGPRVQPRRLRPVLDIWLTLQPIWMAVFYWYTLTKWERGDPTIREPVVVLLLIVGGLAWWVALFWCASMVDEIDRGWRKAAGYAAMLLVPPFGMTVCYFTHLRPRVFESAVDPARCDGTKVPTENP